MLHNLVTLGIADETWKPLALALPVTLKHVLLLSRASPAPLRKQYGPAGSSKPVISLKRLSVSRNHWSVAASCCDTPLPCRFLSTLRNSGISLFELLIGTGSWCKPAGTRSWASSLGPVNAGAAKASSANARLRSITWGQRRRHGSLGTSGMGIVFLRLLLVCAEIGVTGLCFDIRIFGAHVAFSSLERQFNDWSRPLALVGVSEQGDLHVLIPELKRASGRLPVIPANWMNSASCTRSRSCSMPISAEPHSVRSSLNSSSTRTMAFGFFPVFSRNSSTSLCCTCLALDVSPFLSSTQMGCTNSLPFPLGLQVNDAATRLLPANKA